MVEIVTPLFEDDAARHQFPLPIAVALDIMISEIEESGEATTADETAAAIEATCIWLGRLWIAEYLHALEADASLADEAINADLLENVASGRIMTTGQWVGLARRIRTRLDGRATVVRGLAAEDFGDDLGALLEFRNHFSHGSFASSVAEIRHHRQLLHDLLARVPGLREQPVLCRDADTGVVQAATPGWPVLPASDAPAAQAFPAAHPLIAGDNGEVLDLYPMLHAHYTGGHPSLEAPNAQHPVKQLTERTQLAAWIERYQRQREGHLPFPDSWTVADIPDAARAALTADPTREGLVLIAAHPGCHVDAALAAFTDDDPLSLGLDRYAARARVAIRPGDLGQSGLTVARVVLRAIERALGEPEGSRAASAADALSEGGPLDVALDALHQRGERVLIGLEGLHRGTARYRGEPFSVLDVYDRLADTSVTVVATVIEGALHRPLFDHMLALPVPEAPEDDDVRRWVNTLTTQRPLHARVLQTFEAHPPPRTLFEICDALDDGSDASVFEPQVERALWDLKPLLRTARREADPDAQRGSAPTEREREWALGSAAFAPLLGTTEVQR